MLNGFCLSYLHSLAMVFMQVFCHSFSAVVNPIIERNFLLHVEGSKIHLQFAADDNPKIVQYSLCRPNSGYCVWCTPSLDS